MKLVTGACGFIGSSYLKTSERALAVDFRYPEYVLEKHEFVKIDLLREEEVLKLFNEYHPTSVIHLAAISQVGDKNAVQMNVEMTKNILNAANVVGIKHLPPKIILAGSAAEYGNINSDELPPDELAHVFPLEPYAESKAQCANLADQYRKLCNLPITILRFANAYGPNQEKGRLIPNIMNNSITGVPIVLNGLGRQTRQFVYVDDICNAIDLALKRLDDNSGEIFNIGHPQEISMRNVAEIVATQIHDQFLRKGVLAAPAQFEYKPGNSGALRVCMDVTKAKRVLGWTAKVSLEEGIRHTVTAFIEGLSNAVYSTENSGRNLIEAEHLQRLSGDISRDASDSPAK